MSGFAILIYLLFFTLRNFRSSKSLQSLYDQKASILEIYFTYYETIKDKVFFESVVAKTGNTMFEIHNTGLMKESIIDNSENLSIDTFIKLLSKK